MSSEHNTAVNKDDTNDRIKTMPMMSIERILLIDEVDEDNTVVVMSQSFLILRSLPVPPPNSSIVANSDEDASISAQAGLTDRCGALWMGK